MKPIAINGDVWIVRWVLPTDLSLIDRTGKLRIATTDPVNKLINISNAIRFPLLDMVLLHEVTHAITVSYGLLEPIRASIPEDSWVMVEEWSAELIENHGVEAVLLASRSLGRPLCIRGDCV